jgi:hypothetical protein
VNYQVSWKLQLPHGSASHRVTIIVPTNDAVQFACINFNVWATLLGSPGDLSKQFPPKIEHCDHCAIPMTATYLSAGPEHFNEGSDLTLSVRRETFLLVST